MSAADSIATEQTATPASRPARWAWLWQMLGAPSTIIGGAGITIVLLLAVAGPWLWRVDPLALSTGNFIPPGFAHPMGTDDLGRDVLARVVLGAQISLQVGLLSALIATVFGCAFGALSGYLGGAVDEAMMRVAEVFQVVPRFLLAIVIIALFGSGLDKMVLVIGFLSWPGTARVIRAQVLVMRGEDFVLSAIMSGATTGRVILRHIMPSAHGGGRCLPADGGCDPGRILSQLPWSGRPIATELGHAAATGATLPALRLVDDHLPRCRPGGDDILVEPAGRRAERRGNAPGNGLMQADGPLLSVRNLTTEFTGTPTPFRAVDDVSFDVGARERVALVGESGSGKSLTVRSILGLLPAGARTSGGSVRFAGHDLLTMPERKRARLRGGDVALVFQDPMTSWNPVKRVGVQIAEALVLHGRTKPARRFRRVIELLRRVGIPDPGLRARAYPHQFSGGMRQRGMIAMGLANEPRLLIADEPTTALDVTVQDQVIRLLRQLGQESGMAILLITHNLALVASLCDRVIVLYAGRVVETGGTEALFRDPQHPYTWGLLRSVPRLDQARGERLQGVPGQPAQDPGRISGCKFHPRCTLRVSRCEVEEPPLEIVAPGQSARCWVLMRNARRAA